MFFSSLPARDRWTYRLGTVAVVALLLAGLIGWLHLRSADTGPGNLAASWRTYGGSATWRGPCGISACPQTAVVILQDGSYTVTTLYGTNHDSSGHLTSEQAAELAQLRANPDLPSPTTDCGSYLFDQHVKITVVGTDGTSHELDTCMAAIPASSDLVTLLQNLATS